MDEEEVKEYQDLCIDSLVWLREGDKERDIMEYRGQLMQLDMLHEFISKMSLQLQVKMKMLSLAEKQRMGIR
jgi:hypothetical protein